MKQNNFYKNFAKLLFMAILLFGMGFKAQNAFLISFPVNPPPNLTVCNGTSKLTVQLDATIASTSGADVTIQLATGVNYVPGSVAVVSSIGGLTIADNGGTANAPKFKISPSTLAPGNRIIFTIDRLATCAARTFALASGVFTDSVTASIGAQSDTKASSSYQVFYPIITFTQPVAQTNAVVGGTYTRTFNIKNGGNGCLSQLYLSLDNPGSGIQQTSLQVTQQNGATITAITLTPTSTSGTTTYYTVPSTALPGGDLCLNEDITITETYKVKVCGAVTNYSVGWGCDAAPANWCTTSTGIANISMATGVPIVKAVVGSEVKVIGSNFCNNAVLEISIKNQGSEAVAGAGTAFNLVQYFGMDGGEAINVRNPLGIKNIQVSNGAGGWISLTQTGGGMPVSGNVSAAKVDLSQLTTNPGTASGLIDADGDGQYDDLAVNSTVKFRLEVITPAQVDCYSQNKSGGLATQTTYTTGCGTSTTGSHLNAGLITNAEDRNSLNSVISPSDINDGETKTIRINGGNNLNVNNSFIYTCPTNKTVLKIQVPKGISMVAGRFYPLGTASNITTGTQPPYTITGTTYDTLVIEGIETSASTLGNYAFEADIKLNCAAYIPGSITYTIEYQCDATCGTLEKIGCGTINLNAHCTPPCPDGGLTIMQSKFQRTTLGYANPYTTTTYANPSTLSATQLATVMPYDALKGSFKGSFVPSSTGKIFTNHYFSLEYTQLGGQNVLIPTAATFSVTGSVSGTTQTCTIAAPISNTIVSGKHVLVYDLSACGLTINNNDTVLFEPLFTVANNTAFTLSPTQVPGLITKFYSTTAPNASTIYTCDIYSAEFYVHKTDNLRYDGTGNIVNNGCNTYNYNSFLYNTSTQTYDYYPGEIRPNYFLSSIIVNILNGDNFTGTNSIVARGTVAEGYATSSGTTINLAPYAVLSNGNKTATFTNDGTWPLEEASNNGQGMNGYYLTIGLINGCESTTGNVQVIYNYKKFAYAHDMPSVQTSVTDTNFRTVQNTMGILTITNLDGTIQASKSTESFKVRFSSTGTVATPYTWISVPTTVGINVLSIIDLTTNTALPLLNYSGGVWAKLSDTGLASGATHDYRINFTYTTCNSTTFTVEGGWNCPGYPTDPTTYACVKSSTTLTFVPQGAAIQINTDTQPSGNINLCTPLNYEFTVNCGGAGNTINNKFNIKLPAGLTIVPGTLLVEYIRGSGNWQTVTSTTVGDTTTLDLTTHPAYPAQGLPGTLNDGGNANVRQMGVKFNMTTDCSFSSGSYVIVSTNADKTCGQPATGSGSLLNTSTLTVAGADPGYVLSSTVTNPNAPIVGCAGNLTLRIKQIVVLSTATGTPATATITVNYPPGYNIAGTTPNCLTPSFCPTFVSSGVNGTTGLGYAVYSIPVGMQTGDTMEYELTFSPNASINNGSYSTSVVTEDTINGLSCPSAPGGVCSSVKTTTSNAQFNYTLQCYCYKAAVTSGTVLDTKHGVTALGRAGTNNGNWPMVRKGAWTVLEAKTKGFVVNRLTDAQIAALPATELVEGMMVYNITQDCLQINIDGTASGWKCFSTQTCPDY